MKKQYVCLLSALAFTASVIAPSTWADDDTTNPPNPTVTMPPTINRDTIEKLDKDISKNKEKVDSKVSEITTKQTKLEKDILEFGNNSAQVKEDQEALKNMRTELIDLKTELYKNTTKKKVEEGQSIEIEATC